MSFYQKQQIAEYNQQNVCGARFGEVCANCPRLSRKVARQESRAAARQARQRGSLVST
jgi:hypothetical protein